MPANTPADTPTNTPADTPTATPAHGRSAHPTPTPTPSTLAVGLALFGVAVHPTTNRVYVTNNDTSAKPSTSVSVLDGTANTIATSVMPNSGDVKAGIGRSATTCAVTGNVAMAIASPGKVWSGKNVTIGQAGFA